jgi:DNA-binding NtrC family response regulator
MGRAALFLEPGELLDTARLQPRIVATAAQDDTLRAALERAERDHIQGVLDACGHVIADAAERLGIGVSTLYRRIKALGLE